MGKINVHMIKSWSKIRKKEITWKSKKFCINIHLKDRLKWNSQLAKASWCQRERRHQRSLLACNNFRCMSLSWRLPQKITLRKVYRPVLDTLVNTHQLHRHPSFSLPFLALCIPRNPFTVIWRVQWKHYKVSAIKAATDVLRTSVLSLRSERLVSALW